MLQTLKNAINFQKPHKTNSDGYIRHIEIDKLEPLMPSHNFSEKEIIRLADNILKHGIINPIPVYSDGKNYKYITGSRRIAASMLIGRKNIICHVYTDINTCDNILIASVMHNQTHNPFKIYDMVCYFNTIRGLTLTETAQKLSITISDIKNLMELECFTSEERRKLSQIKLDPAALIELAKLTHIETRTAVIERLCEENKAQTSKVRKILREIHEEHAETNLNGTAIIDNTFTNLVNQIKKVNKLATLKKRENKSSTSYTVLVPKGTAKNVSRET